MSYHACHVVLFSCAISTPFSNSFFFFFGSHCMPVFMPFHNFAFYAFLHEFFFFYVRIFHVIFKTLHVLFDVYMSLYQYVVFDHLSVTSIPCHFKSFSIVSFFTLFYFMTFHHTTHHLCLYIWMPLRCVIFCRLFHKQTSFISLRAVLLLTKTRLFAIPFHCMSFHFVPFNYVLFHFRVISFH